MVVIDQDGLPQEPAATRPAGPARSPAPQAFPPLPPAEARLRMLFEKVPSGIALHELVLDATGRPIDYVFLEVNAAFERQTGLSREAILGRRVTEVLPGIERDPADWIGTYGKVALTGEPIRFEQYSSTLGRCYDVKAYSPARGYFGVIFNDVTAQVEARTTVERLATERQGALDDLRDEVRLRERFIDILGHDLRLPMTVIRTGVETLLRHEGIDARPTLERCSRATHTMEALVETLLDAARARSGLRVPIAPVDADLAGLCRGVVDDARAFAPGRQVLLEVDGDLTVRWDPARMSQALGNLLVNALTHGDPEGTVRVSAGQRAGEVEIAVANAGPPISPEALPTLFEPFSRARAAGAGRGGLGLGLFIVREIATAHGGSVEVASRDGWTVFTLRVPRAAPREP
jgi:two-component system, sensor histidine kinase and response regulator